jgi:hypothetical protein
MNENSLKNLRPFDSTHQPEKNGRKPSALNAFIRDSGISIDDVRRVMKNVIFEKNQDELQALLTDKAQPMLIRLLVKAFLTDFSNGRLDNIEKLLDRIYGKSTQSVEVTDKTPTHVDSSLVPDDIMQKIMDKYIDEIDDKETIKKENNGQDNSDKM